MIDDKMSGKCKNRVNKANNVVFFTHRFFFSPIAAGTPMGFASAMMMMILCSVAGKCRARSRERDWMEDFQLWFGLKVLL